MPDKDVFLRKLFRTYCAAGSDALESMLPVEGCPICGSDKYGDGCCPSLLADASPKEIASLPADVIAWAQRNGDGLYDCTTYYECESCGFHIRFGMYLPLTEEPDPTDD